MAAEFVYEDEEIYAIKDINPQAPIHILIIPKKHITSIAHLEDKDAMLIAKLVQKARDIAKEKGLNKDGYRLVFNTGALGGQTVMHIHLHLLGGRAFRWPPG